jgi:hypothetical protein
MQSYSAGNGKKKRIQTTRQGKGGEKKENAVKLSPLPLPISFFFRLQFALRVFFFLLDPRELMEQASVVLVWNESVWSPSTSCLPMTTLNEQGGEMMV